MDALFSSDSKKIDPNLTNIGASSEAKGAIGVILESEFEETPSDAGSFVEKSLAN